MIYLHIDKSWLRHPYHYLVDTKKSIKHTQRMSLKRYHYAILRSGVLLGGSWEWRSHPTVLRSYSHSVFRDHSWWYLGGCMWYRGSNRITCVQSTVHSLLHLSLSLSLFSLLFHIAPPPPTHTPRSSFIIIYFVFLLLDHTLQCSGLAPSWL